MVQKFSEKKGPLRRFFGSVRQRRFERKSWYPPPSHKNFSIEVFFWKLKESPTEFLGTERKSIFDKIVIHHLMQFLYSRIFLNKSVPLGVFSVVWDKKVLRESRDIPLLAIKNFDNWKILKNEGFPYESFQDCEKIIFRQNRDTPSYAMFFNPEVFSNKKVTLGRFLVLSDKKVSRENRDIPLLSINFFDQRNFLKNEGFPYEFSRYCEKIIIRQNCDTPSYKNFFNQTFSERQASPTNFFGTVRQKSFERKSWSPPPSHKIVR